MTKFLSKDGVLYLWQKITNTFVKKEAGKGLSSNDYTKEEKDKLANLENYDDSTIVGSLANKVDKVTGKGLSTNDLTNELLEKINNAGNSSFSGNYEDLTNKPDLTVYNNKIESIKVNGTAQTITAKSINISVPTNNSELANGAGYQTASQVETAITGKGYQTASQVTTSINNAIAGVTQFDYSIVASLPASGKKGTIYLVANSGTGNNVYDEYIWLNNKFEKLGTTEVDLTGYLKTTDIESITNAEIDTIVAS